ncbi:MAG: peptidylprolyl isomerase [Alphaproteobacteria bacterium]|nr:MAG: peptidylprolyl isomerase [Alphaproteobacteria bacterium]
MRLLLTTLIAVFMVATTGPNMARAADLENTLFLDLKDGRVTIEMYPDVAPKHVARIKELVRQGFYDGLTFHRVIPGFMAQGGDPEGTGTGGSGQHIPAEFSDMTHLKGTLSMARATDPDSADSQFFIVLDVSAHLDGQYTIWGRVIGGMKYVDRIKEGVVPDLKDPDKIIKMQIAADVETKE